MYLYQSYGFTCICTAYRIHVNQSTVDVLKSLNLGYKIDVRGLTELKVNKMKRDANLYTCWSIRYVLLATDCWWLFICREKVLRPLIGWWVKRISPNLCLILETFQGKRMVLSFTHVNRCNLSDWIRFDHFKEKVTAIKVACCFLCSNLRCIKRCVSYYRGCTHVISLEEIPADRRQKFLDRQKKTN